MGIRNFIRRKFETAAYREERLDELVEKFNSRYGSEFKMYKGRKSYIQAYIQIKPTRYCSDDLLWQANGLWETFWLFNDIIRAEWLDRTGQPAGDLTLLWENHDWQIQFKKEPYDRTVRKCSLADFIEHEAEEGMAMWKRSVDMKDGFTGTLNTSIIYDTCENRVYVTVLTDIASVVKHIEHICVTEAYKNYIVLAIRSAYLTEQILAGSSEDAGKFDPHKNTISIFTPSSFEQKPRTFTLEMQSEIERKEAELRETEARKARENAQKDMNERQLAEFVKHALET